MTGTPLSAASHSFTFFLILVENRLPPRRSSLASLFKISWDRWALGSSMFTRTPERCTPGLSSSSTTCNVSSRLSMPSRLQGSAFMTIMISVAATSAFTVSSDSDGGVSIRM